MWQDIEASMKRIRDLGLRVKSGITYDVARFFEDVKIGVRTIVWDCRPFYALCGSTMKTLCNQGIRLYIGVHDGGGLSSFLRLVQFYCEHSLQSRRQAEFIKERVKASAKLWQDIEASMKRIRDLGLRAKSGIAYDVARSFEDVKIEHVHQLTRIQDARDQGFRLHWSLRNFFLSSSPPPYWQ
ncbi:uncharacterized protein LOC142563166 isoform X1 [Dermacentor variabilis]|uniref:uncharacterized protein LOC142563166 isoform X1 n=1 Tax=Dermacentor variabilis TaxID=34621 RepID=UPI003F5BFB4A